MLKEVATWINLDKPVGISSARAVAIVKRITGAKKVGHGGTLDPAADGLLPIALNKATKTAEKLMSAQKRYSFCITFGEFRDTDDSEGVVIESSAARPQAKDMISVFPFFVGRISQTPSRFSAIKINGQRAYDLARQNVEFEVPSREVEIFSLKLITLNETFAELEAECSKGTYIRSLARDLCKKMEVCGYVSKLTRLQVGKFSYDKRISLDALKAVHTYGPRFLDDSLLSLQDVL